MSFCFSGVRSFQTRCWRRCPRWNGAVQRTLPIDMASRCAVRAGMMSPPVFPTTAVFSISYLMADVGSAVALMAEKLRRCRRPSGSGPAPSRAAVLSAVGATESTAVASRCERGGSMLSVLLRYTQSYIAHGRRQSRQSAPLDRPASCAAGCSCSGSEPTSSGGHPGKTHLMVVPPKANGGGPKLQTPDLRYQRGHIAVVDSNVRVPPCECYEVVRLEADRLLEMPLQCTGSDLRRSRPVSAAAFSAARPWNCQSWPKENSPCFTALRRTDILCFGLVTS